MEAVIYYAEAEGISLERMVRKGNFNMRVKHFHNQYEIFYLIEGERRFFFDNRPYIVRGGDLILVDENVIHMTKDNDVPEFGHDRIILYVDKNKMLDLDSKFPHLNLVEFFHRHYGVFHLDFDQQTAFINFYIRLMNEFEKKDRCYKSVIEMEIILYFIRFMRENHVAAEDEISTSNNPKFQHVYQVADYISKHYTESFTLESLSAQFFISKYYLCRVFKEITGYSVNEYVNIHRIQQAKRMLEETDLNVAEVAARLGYESTSYFEKIFKRYMTISPLRYRKTLNIVTYTNKPLDA